MTTQFSWRITEIGDNWIELFSIPSFVFQIYYSEICQKFKPRFSKEFVYMIYSTGSIGSNINAAKQKLLEIPNFLINKFQVFNFSFGGVFNRNLIDCSSDIHETHVLTNNKDIGYFTFVSNTTNITLTIFCLQIWMSIIRYVFVMS